MHKCLGKDRKAELKGYMECSNIFAINMNIYNSKRIEFCDYQSVISFGVCNVYY